MFGIFFLVLRVGGCIRVYFGVLGFYIGFLVG